MTAQLALGMSFDRRQRTKRGIQALHLPPVADVNNPQHGPDEIPPTPGLDAPGTVYSVGVERERWVIGPEGGLRNADGEPVGMKAGVAELQRRGARIMRLERCWGLPSLVRRSERHPLVEEGWELSRRWWTVEPHAPVEVTDEALRRAAVA